MTTPAIELDQAASPEIFAAMFSALERETARTVGPIGIRPLALPLRDSTGEVAGGLWGATLYDWLAIQLLLVPGPLQNQGIGTALIRRAEEEALLRGCRGAFVDTFDFQAEGFYRRLGFDRFGVLDDFPAGHKRIYLSKSFGSPR